MKNTLSLLMILIFTISCKQDKEQSSIDTVQNQQELKRNNETKETVKAIDTKAYNAKDLIGNWYGDFGAKKLDLKILRIANDSLFGNNTVNDNKRGVKGEFDFENNSSLITAILHEPGDDKYDGVFYVNFRLDSKAADGYWESNNGKLKRDFSLKKVTNKTETVIREINNIKSHENNKSRNTEVEELIVRTEKLTDRMMEVVRKIKYYGDDAPYSLIKEYENLEKQLQQVDIDAKKFEGKLTDDEQQRLKKIAEKLAHFILAQTSN